LLEFQPARRDYQAWQNPLYVFPMGGLCEHIDSVSTCTRLYINSRPSVAKSFEYIKEAER